MEPIVSIITSEPVTPPLLTDIDENGDYVVAVADMPGAGISIRRFRDGEVFSIRPNGRDGAKQCDASRYYVLGDWIDNTYVPFSDLYQLQTLAEAPERELCTFEDVDGFFFRVKNKVYRLMMHDGVPVLHPQMGLPKLFKRPVLDCRRVVLASAI